MNDSESSCDDCGRRLAAGDCWDVSLSGGWLCRACSESIAPGQPPYGDHLTARVGTASVAADQR
jgi:hypothetical protein